MNLHSELRKSTQLLLRPMSSSSSSSSSPNGQPQKRRRGRPRLPLVRFVTDRSTRECRWCGQLVVNDDWTRHWTCRSIKLRAINGEVYACLRKGCHFTAPEPRFLLTHATEDVPCPNFYTTEYGERWNESKDSRERVIQTSHVWLVNSPVNSDEWFHPRNFLETSKSTPPTISEARNAHLSATSQLGTTPCSYEDINSISHAEIEQESFENSDDELELHGNYEGMGDSQDEDDEDEAKLLDALRTADEKNEAHISQSWSRIDLTTHSTFERVTQDFNQGCPVRLALKRFGDTNGGVKPQTRLENIRDLEDFISSNLADLVLGHQKYLANKQNIHSSCASLVRNTAEDGHTVKCTIAQQRLHKSKLWEICVKLETQNNISRNVHKAAKATVSAMFGPPLPKARQILRQAASQNHAMLYQIEADVSDLAAPVQSARIYTFHLRDPILLAFNLLSSPEIFADGETSLFEPTQLPENLENPQDGLRFLEMQTCLRDRAKHLQHLLETQSGGDLSQFSESQKEVWKKLNIDKDLCPLPLIIYIDETHIGKAGRLSACPIVMSVLSIPSSTLRRDSAKRVIGFLSVPPPGSGPELARSRYKRGLRQTVLIALFEIIKAWQTVAFRKGGLIFRHGARSVRCIPILGFVIGDSKELNELTCTLQNTRCRFCSSDAKSFSDGVAMPLRPPRDVITLRKAYDEIPKTMGARRSKISSAFTDEHGIHAEHVTNRNALFETSMDFFSKYLYQLFPYDQLHTFHLGPPRDALIAAICCANLKGQSSYSRLKLELGKSSGSIPNLASQGVKLQLYLHEAGNLKHDCIKRKLQAKDIMPLVEGVISAFIHDSLFPNEKKKLGLSRIFRSILWTLVSFVIIGHELARQSLPRQALQTLRESVENAVHLVQAYRVQVDQWHTSSLVTLKLHALRHLPQVIEHTGGVGVMDSDHFEHYHLVAGKLAARVNNKDDTSLHRLWRCIELDVATDYAPKSPPKRVPRCRLLGRPGGQSDLTDCNATSLTEQVLENLRFVSHQEVRHRQSDLEALILSSYNSSQESEGEALSSCQLEFYKSASMKERRLTVWGSDSESATPKTVLLSKAGNLFVPLGFFQARKDKKRAPYHRTSYCIAVQIEIDSSIHERLSQITYRHQQLCGFRVANGDKINVANIVCKNVDEFACCSVFKLRPNVESCKLMVCWPVGATAFPSWSSSPFLRPYFNTPEIPHDDFDDTERCIALLDEYQEICEGNNGKFKAKRTKS